MASNKSKNTCQIWISKNVHKALSEAIKSSRRTLRAEAEVGIAAGLGFKTIQELEEAFPLTEEDDVEEEA